MECRDCTRYDTEARKCMDGKLNPHSWEATVSVAQIFGLRSICMFNDFREKLVNTRKPLTKENPGRLPSR